MALCRYTHNSPLVLYSAKNSTIVPFFATIVPSSKQLCTAYMKKGLILELIRCHTDGNENGFRSVAYEIAKVFDQNGDEDLARFIMAQLSDANAFEPQEFVAETAMQLSDFFYKMPVPNEPLPLPLVIEEDVIAILRAIEKPIGIHKFLFYGAPGSGKTESVKHIARLLKRDLYCVDFSRVIDSKLGQTAKNIHAIFDEMKSCSHKRNILFLLDEIDILALDRTNQQDLREMGRATSTVLRKLDELDEKIILFATTNLFDHFDKALVRRFDAIVNFNRYSAEDLLAIADRLLEYYLGKFKRSGRKTSLFHKILALPDVLPYPGEMKNLIKRSIVFSNAVKEFDYLRRLYREITGDNPKSIEILKQQKFTLREMEILTGRSKSQIARDLKEKDNE